MACVAQGNSLLEFVSVLIVITCGHLPWSVPYAWSDTLDLEGHIFPKFFLVVIVFANYV